MVSLKIRSMRLIILIKIKTKWPREMSSEIIVKNKENIGKGAWPSFDFIWFMSIDK